MYLKSLELTGFKSFAKKTVLEFKTPITAIVGPNGSGKSNVAEAFRFVLGEQSIKSMRGKRGEDLIFNGGADAARANRAGVKVNFDNTKRLFNLDFDEVVIERIVHRDGVNEYLLNGSQVRLKDIIEMLAHAHIGASGHHIISQGEADRILNAPFKERKEMIEDALGLKIYQYKKHESERKLEKTEENIKSVESLRREIAPHIKFLKKQVEKVERALEMKQELLALYREYLKREDDYIKKTKSDLSAKEKPIREELVRLENELKEAKSILEKSAGRDEKSDKIIEIEGKIKSARDEKDNLVRAIGRLEGEISSHERLIADAKKRAESEESKSIKLEDVRKFSDEITAEIDKAINSGDENIFKKALNLVREAFKSFLHKNSGRTDDSTLREWENNFSELNKEKKELEIKLDSEKSREEKLNKEYASIKNEIEKEKDKSRDAEKAVFKIMGEQKDAISKIHLIESEKNHLALTEEEFKRELSEGSVLVGREILEFSRHEIKGGGAGDDRHEQETRRKAIERIKIRLEDAGLGGGDDVMKEYKEVTGRDEFLSHELEDLKKSAQSLKELISELEEKLSTLFQDGVKKINTEFENYFVLMFGGGHASLTLVREKKKRPKIFDDTEDGSSENLPGDDIFANEEKIDEGLEISVNLPRKKIKGLDMLSGGERALTSIALLFAISQVNPPPFIILDETDAALDEANSRKYGDMIENLSKHSQLILITHNRETMSRAGVIYGVTMGGSGISALLSIAFEEAVAVAK